MSKSSKGEILKNSQELIFDKLSKVKQNRFNKVCKET